MILETIPTGNDYVKNKLPLGNLPTSNYSPELPSMDRKKALKNLIDENYRSIAEFCRAVGQDPSYISRCMWPDDKKGVKKIGVEIIDAIGLVHPFWDYEYSNPLFASKIRGADKISPLTEELLEAFERLESIGDKNAVIGLASRLAATQHKSKSNPTTRQVPQKQTGTDG